MNIYQRTNFILSFLFCLIASTSAYASELDTQRVVFSSDKPAVEYRLTLSALKTVNAAVVAERDVLIEGQLNRTTYEFISGQKQSEAWSMLTKELRFSDYRELFSCDGLSCGSSNAWANNRFGIKQLYGLDQTQKYRAFALESEGAVEYLIVYFVKRGNKRIYAQVDKLVSENTSQRIAESSSTILRLIEKQGFYSLPVDSNSGFSEVSIELLVKALKTRPITKFYVVGHCNEHRKYEENLACSESYAQQLTSVLIEQGVSERRLDVKWVANLAPRQALGNARVELVVLGAGF